MLSFFVQLVALILGIVALVQSRKAGAKNGFAVAAIICIVILLMSRATVSISTLALDRRLRSNGIRKFIYEQALDSL